MDVGVKDALPTCFTVHLHERHSISFKFLLKYICNIFCARCEQSVIIRANGMDVCAVFFWDHQGMTQCGGINIEEGNVMFIFEDTKSRCVTSNNGTKNTITHEIEANLLMRSLAIVWLGDSAPKTRRSIAKKGFTALSHIFDFGETPNTFRTLGSIVEIAALHNVL